VAWRKRANIAAILAVCCAASFGLGIIYLNRDAVPAFYYPQSRIWELLFGALLALPRGTQHEAKGAPGWPPIGRLSFPAGARGDALRNLASAAGLLLIAAAVFGLNEYQPFPGWRAGLPVVGAALLLAAGPQTWINRSLLAHPVLVSIGLVSYPLYLWHWPLLSLLNIVHTGAVSAGARAGAVVGSFVLAYLTYWLIERPIRLGRRSWAKNAALCGLLAAMGAAGLATEWQGGFTARFKGIEDFAAQLQQTDIRGGVNACRQSLGLRADGYCVRSSASLPDTALIGDSHANSLFPGFMARYRQAGRSLVGLGGGGCPPFFDTDFYLYGEHPVGCRDVINEALEYAANSPSVRSIVLSMYALRHMNGDILLGGFRPTHLLFYPEPELHNPESFWAAFRHTLTALAATGKEVIVIIDWPELSFDPRSCVDRLRDVIVSCANDLAMIKKRNDEYRRGVGALQIEFPQVKWFDPTPLFCGDSECTAMPTGRLAYRDSNHLSRFGSEYLADKFAAALELKNNARDAPGIVRPTP
jgi:hypothetical protein